MNARKVWKTILPGGLLIGLTIGVFAPAVQFDAIPFVEDRYVLKFQDAAVEESSGETNPSESSQAPSWRSALVDQSFRWEASIRGASARGFHLTNIGLHVLNVLLLWRVLVSLTGSEAKSGLVAALFAIHPAQIDAVAWFAGRYELLSAAFGLLSLFAYVRFVSRRGKAWYGLSLAAFACSLLSHPALLSLPLLLVVFDFWPLKRSGPAVLAEANRFSAIGVGKQWLEKAPYFAVVLLAVAVSFSPPESGESVASPGGTWSQRLGNHFLGLSLSAVNLFSPGTEFVDPAQLSDPVVLTGCLAVLLPTLLFWSLAGRCGYLLAGWLWFVGTVTPLGGQYNVSTASILPANTYFAIAGIFIATVWLVAQLFATRPVFRHLLLPLAAAAILLLCGLFSREAIAGWTEKTRYYAAWGVRQAGGSFDIAEFQGEQFVSHVSLAVSRIDDEQLRHLAAFRGLKTLDLSDTAITDQGVPHLMELRGLTALHLDGTRLTDKGVCRLVGLSRIRTLGLSGTDVTDGGVRCLAELQQLSELRLGLTQIRGPGLAHLAGVNRLESLVMSGPHVTDETLKFAGGIRSLRGLDLHEARVTDEGLRHLRSLSRMQSIRLNGTRIRGEGLKHLTRLQQLRSLELIDAEVAEEHLEALADLPRLEILLLDNTRTDDKGLEMLAEIDSLKTLHLANTAVTDAGLTHLGSLHRLRSLSLAGTQITDGGLTHLKSVKSLRDLNLSFTRVSRAGAKNLQTSLPRATIVY